jgi:hypothetical protein
MDQPVPAFLAATQAAYVTLAADYADLLRNELAGRPLGTGPGLCRWPTARWPG